MKLHTNTNRGVPVLKELLADEFQARETKMIKTDCVNLQLRARRQAKQEERWALQDATRRSI
jgi:hypothetical protein